MYGRYHLTDPSSFYTQENAWQISADPNQAGVGSTGTAPGAVDANGNPIDASSHPMDPYYLLMRQPGDATESFLMLRPFVPKQAGLNKQVLTGFMTAQSDPHDYGRLDLFQLPADNLPSGPYNVAAQMMQDPKVSSTQTLLCNSSASKGGSECEYGNLLVIPIDQSLLYVRPWYVKASGNALPELQRVIVGFQDQSGNLQVAVNRTFHLSLVDLFGPRVVDPGTETHPPASVDSCAVGSEQPGFVVELDHHHHDRPVGPDDLDLALEDEPNPVDRRTERGLRPGPTGSQERRLEGLRRRHRRCATHRQRSQVGPQLTLRLPPLWQSRESGRQFDDRSRCIGQAAV